VAEKPEDPKTAGVPQLLKQLCDNLKALHIVQLGLCLFEMGFVAVVMGQLNFGHKTTSFACYSHYTGSEWMKQVFNC
jgi:hypothetical protein